MKRVLALVLLSVALIGCRDGSTLVTKQTTVVVKPPETLYNCPIETKFPINPTNKQVGDVIAKLDKNNKICYKNINAIHTFVNEAEKVYAEKPK